jgi:hypothetical protein
MTSAQSDLVEQESQEHSTTRIKYRNGNTFLQKGQKNDNTSVGHQTSLTQIRLSKRVAISRQHGSSNEIQLLQPKGKQINVKHDSQSHPVAQTIRSTSRLGLTTRLKETRCTVDRTTRQNGQGYDRREWTSAK